MIGVLDTPGSNPLILGTPVQSPVPPSICRAVPCVRLLLRDVDSQRFPVSNIVASVATKFVVVATAQHGARNTEARRNSSILSKFGRSLSKTS